MDTIESLQKKINDVKDALKKIEKEELRVGAYFNNEQQCRLSDKLLDLEEKLTNLKKRSPS